MYKVIFYVLAGGRWVSRVQLVPRIVDQGWFLLHVPLSSAFATNSLCDLGQGISSSRVSLNCLLCSHSHTQI